MRELMIAALLLGCEPFEEDCERLASELERCDLPPARIACERLSPREVRGLVGRFEELECSAPFVEGNDDPDFAICDLLGWECPTPLFAFPSPQPTAHPIVLVGGIDGSAAFSFNRRIVAALEAAGPNQVHSVQPSPWSVPEVRAAELQLALERLASGRPDARFNLICYAVGGIDCRLLAAEAGLDAAERIASITTVATPHRGTNVAQAALDLAYGDARAIVSAIAGGVPPDDTALEVVLRRLTPEAMERFNGVVLDVPSIFYQSWAGTSHLLGQPWVPSEAGLLRDCRNAGGELLIARSGQGYDVMSGPLAAAAPFAGDSVGDTTALLRPSDGMVAVTSAKWGVFRGCMPADHYDLIGQIGDRGVDPSSGFDAAAFYANVAVDLARRGL